MTDNRKQETTSVPVILDKSPELAMSGAGDMRRCGAAVVAAGGYTKRPVGWLCGPTDDDGFYLVAYDPEEEEPSAYYLVVDLTRANLERLRNTVKLALAIAPGRLKGGRTRRGVKRWMSLDGKEVFSPSPDRRTRCPRPYVVDRTLRITIDGGDSDAAGALAAGEYVATDLDWCWSYSTRGGICLHAASVQGSAMARYPVFHLTYTSLGQLGTALDEALDDIETGAS